MTPSLKEKILERMAAKGLSIAELERLAGLSIHSVRNIVKGRIKRPSAQSLQAIAEVLDCSILDLVDSSPVDVNLTLSSHKRKGTGTPLTHHSLMLDCCQAALDISSEFERSLSLEEYFDVVKKIYTYSSKEEPIKLDARFAHWLIETQLNGARKPLAS